MANLFNSFSVQKPYYGFSHLAIGKHSIEKFRLTPNKFYNKKEVNSFKKSLVCELSDQVLFLPNYFSAQFNEDKSLIETVNNDGVKRFLCFGGKRDNK